MKKSIKCAALLLLLTTAGCASTTKLNEALSSQDEEIVETEVEEEEPEVTVEEESEEPEEIEEEEPEPIVEETNPVAAIEPDEEEEMIEEESEPVVEEEDDNSPVDAYKYPVITWPTGGIADLIPKYKADETLHGLVTRTDSFMQISVHDQPLEKFQQYVNELAEYGFNQVKYQFNTGYLASNSDGDEVHLTYFSSEEDFIIQVSLHKEDEESE